MAQRTQMRLHAITGSLTAINNGIANADVAPVGSSDAFAENMLGAMGHIAGAIKRIHGNSDFLAEDRGVFTHATSRFIGVLSASSDLKAGGALDIELGADIGGASDLHGAVHAFSTLNVDSEATLASAVVEDLTSGRVVLAGAGGAIEDSANLTFNGSALAVIGAVSGSGNFTVGGNLEVNGTSTLGGNLTIEAGADLIVQDLTNGRVVLVGASDRLVDDAQITHSAGQLTVSGSTFSKDVSIVRDLTVGKDLSAISGSFSGDLTVTGDLIINGTTTTINSTVVSVDDKAIELGATTSPTNGTADGGGIILKGATDHTILWRDTQDAWEFSEHLVPGGAKDLGLTGDRWTNLWLSGNADVDGTADIQGALTLQAGVTVAGAAAFNGLVDVNAGMSASFIKIDGDVAQRLYIVDADGSVKDEAKLTFDGSELLVDAHLEVSGAADLKSTLTVASGADLNGALDVALASDLHGAVHAYSTFLADGAADFKSSMLVTGSVNMLSTVHAVDDMTLDAELDVAGESFFANHINLDKAADQSILKTGGDLYMSASADLRLQAGGDVKLVDMNRGGSTWGDAEGIKLSSSSVEWTNFKSTFGSEVSILAALVGGGSGGKYKADISATAAFVTASSMLDLAGGANFASKWASLVEPKISKVDVFVNGQLMVSGSGMDYNVASNGDVTFGFDLVNDDIVVVKVG